MTRNYIFPSILIVVLMQSCVLNAVLNVDGCLKNPGVVNRENSVSIYQKSVKKKIEKSVNLILLISIVSINR